MSTNPNPTSPQPIDMDTDTDTASDSSPPQQNTTPHAHTYILDTDSEDGGMQLEPADGELLHFAEDDSDIEFDDRIMGVAMEEERDENDFTTRPINPHSATPNAHNTPSQPGNRDEYGFPPRLRDRPRPRPRRLRTSGQLTEEQHAALCVLGNWELLVSHALNSHRTIPQTRRRFQAKLLSPNNPVLENELYASRFIIPASQSEFLPPASPGPGSGTGAGRAYETASGAENTTAFLVPGAYREVVDGDSSSWWPLGRPRVKRRSERGSGVGGGVGGGGGSGSGESSRVVSRGGSRAASRGPA